MSIYLIGGAPTTGKSTVAAQLAAHLVVPWISTDQIRTIMQSIADPQQFPHLFSSVGVDAESFLTTYSAQEIAEMEVQQSEIVWQGVQKFIRDAYPWENSFIIEGIAILPHLVARDFPHTPDIKTIFLTDRDPERIRQVVFTRGLWGDASSYSDEVKEKEVEWVLCIQEKIITTAQEYAFPCLEMTKEKRDFPALCKALEIPFI